MSRPLAVAACCALLAAPAAGAANLGGGTFTKAAGSHSGTPPKSWAQPQIRVVVAHGLMAKSVANFRPNDALTQGELSTLMAALTDQAPQAPPDPTAIVTLTKLDARLVAAIHLSDAAAAFVTGARAAGLAVPARFGTETVARLLGLRTNHPAKDDDLELLPSSPVTRAETAYSVAKILQFQGWEQQYVEDAVATRPLPHQVAGGRRVGEPAGARVGI